MREKTIKKAPYRNFSYMGHTPNKKKEMRVKQMRALYPIMILIAIGYVIFIVCVNFGVDLTSFGSVRNKLSEVKTAIVEKVGQTGLSVEKEVISQHEKTRDEVLNNRIEIINNRIANKETEFGIKSYIQNFSIAIIVVLLMGFTVICLLIILAIYAILSNRRVK